MSFMEDIGYYCIDNMPAELISTFMNLMDKSDKYNKIAIVTDVRSRAFSMHFAMLLISLNTITTMLKSSISILKIMLHLKDISLHAGSTLLPTSFQAVSRMH